jgi:hypothetical protein
MKQRALAVMASLLLIAAPAAAAEKKPEKILLVRVTTRLDGRTDRTALVFRTVASALNKGHHVTLFFDAEGISSLKMGRWFGGHSTPIDRVRITAQERKDLAALLGTAPDGIPDIYGSLLHFLKGRGVAVMANKRALELRGLWPDRFDQAAEAIDEAQALDLIARATWQMSY